MEVTYLHNRQISSCQHNKGNWNIENKQPHMKMAHIDSKNRLDRKVTNEEKELRRDRKEIENKN